MYRLILFLLVVTTSLIAQTPRKPLSRTINRPSDNQIAPCLSGDGRTMIYMSSYSESGALEVKTSNLQRGGSWSDPEDIDVLNKWTSNNFQGGYFLSYDGNTIVFTSRKVPGIGKFDIWITEKTGSSWSAPVNLGKPVNSTGNEGSPSLSPDGKLLYFMRCEKMTTKDAENCKLMVSERRGNYWNEPKELPSPINMGHETAPRILGDNQTLVFSSERAGGKGGLDYYLSRVENGEWQQPVAMDYLNTPEDDQFVSIPLKGNIAYYSMVYRGYNAIIMAQIPEDLQPRKVTLIDGTVTANGQPIDAFLQVYDLTSGELVQHGRPNPDGSFRMIIPEGGNYDFSVTSKDNQHLYYAKVYEQQEMEVSNWEINAIELAAIKRNYSWENTNIGFETASASLRSTSEFELKRLLKLLKNNPDINLSLEIYTDEVIEDTLKSDPDLTEVRQDSIEFMTDSIVFDTVWVTPTEELIDEGETIDYTQDSLQFAEEGNYEEYSQANEFSIDTVSFKVKRFRVVDIYHNDRTPLQAETLQEYFREKGVPEDRFIILGLGDINNLVSNDSKENRATNQRIKVTIE